MLGSFADCHDQISRSGSASTIIRHRSFAVWIGLLTLMTSQADGAVRIGIGVGVTDKAGAFDSKPPALSPALLVEVSSLPNVGGEIEYFHFTVDQGLRRVSYSRGTLWIERKARVLLFHQAFDLASGIGWSYLSRSDGSDRGALGFRAGAGYPFKVFNDRMFEAGLRYTGTPWAGSGVVEDRIELTLGAFLFDIPTESNPLP